MKFINRSQELDRLDSLMAGADSALAVLYGRRRIGKTRLLLECRRGQVVAAPLEWQGSGAVD